MYSKSHLLVSLTNIPTPYRVHFYRQLKQALTRKGIKLQVWFMAYTEPGRLWKFDAKSFGFDCLFSPGTHPVIKNYPLHINPIYFYSLVKNPPRWLLLSGGWPYPTYLGALLISLTQKTKVIIWNESNLAYMEHSQSFPNLVRRLVLDSADAYVVPGRWAKEYINYYAPSSSNKPIIRLPNIIDDERYESELSKRRLHVQVLRDKWNLPSGKRILLTLARLEPIKGIDRMLQAWMIAKQSKQWIWVIAGDGSLRESLQKKIHEAGLDNSVLLLGHRCEDDLLDLLSIAEVFALPSIGDAYPLAVIEAMFAELPLLLSDRVGCHPETLNVGQNGLLFNPFEILSIQWAIDKLLENSSNTLKMMGLYSKSIAENQFSTQNTISSFLNNLVLI